MKAILTIIFVVLISSSNAFSQGCVAIRSTGGMCSMTGHHSDSSANSAGWIFSNNHRYFKSFRHFKGSEEQAERVESGTEVINYQYSLDLVLTRIFNSRWSALIDVPILANHRTSLYEHGRESRHATGSFGLGDIRLAAYRWMLDPHMNKKGNVQLGLGIKFPTGDYGYEDYFYNVGPEGGKELRPVDQSIQLGDGGTGITAEVNSFYSLGRNLGIYGNFYYLSNPSENNGVFINRRRVNESIMSVPDQYMGRAGFNFPYKSLVATAGFRLEGIPVNDLIGKSGDFRRPGYVWSAEPGLTLQHKNLQFYATAPVALYRNRTQSVTDRENTVLEGSLVHGDAAFADYSLNVGMSVKF